MRRYVLITPCRDEADYLQKTIDSVARQTELPAKWVVVDDGSTDATPEILSAAQEKYDFIEVIRREDRGKRSVGPGVVDAFYCGLDSLDLNDYDFLCKLDGDLEFGEKYFATLMDRFEKDPQLGNLSGKLFLEEGDRYIEERLRDDNAVGPAKFYRVSCFQDIGGFVRQVSWDGIDGHVCRMHGWIPAALNEKDLRITHLRRMGSSEVDFWEGRKRYGRGKYFMGSRLYYVIAITFYRMFEKPYVISGVGILVGFVKAVLANQERYRDEAYLKHFRKYELESLIFGRNKTTRKFDAVARQIGNPEKS